MTDSNPSPWQLIEQGGQNKQADLPTAGTLIIGSSAERAALVLAGQGVEAAHCAIGCVKSGGWAIKDLGSQFGTFVNGSKVQSKRLALGDVIVVGSVRLEVLEAGAKPKATQVSLEELPLTELPKAGRQLDGYVIESTLGKGGMGEVVLALQESLNRHVAIKLLSTKLASDREFVKAFHSEARSAAALNHSNVVVVHDVGEQNGLHYLAMEYMPGGSLEERVQAEGRLHWREVLNILHDAAAGLAYAESQGIVHRDIKPANLMLAASGAVKIADLGLALNVDEQGAGDSAEGRKTFGTPHFISPEQARGLAVDQRSDLYSLGATAYRLLSGRTPFQGETTRDIVRARFLKDPAPLANSVPGMPAGLHDLVHKLMQREPDERYASARELLSAVDLLRLRADHGGSDQEADEAPEKKASKLPLVLGAGALLAAAAFFLKGSGESAEPSTRTSDPSSQAKAGPSARGNQAGPSDSESFFGNGDTPGANQTEEDNLELQLLRLERDAVAELRRIPSGLSAADQILELEAFAQRFAGTDTAAQALADAEHLRSTNLLAERAAAETARLLEQSLATLKTHIGWPQPATNPATLAVLLGRLAAYLPPAELAHDPHYREGLQGLRLEIINQLEKEATKQISAAEIESDKGNFEPLRLALAAAHKSLLPGAVQADEPKPLAGLRTKCEAINKRLANLDALKLSFEAERASSDRALLALCLGPRSDLRAELLDLRLGLPLARIQSTLAQLQTESARQELTQLAASIQAAQRALDLLSSTHAEGLWKRKTVNVPKNPRRSTSKEAVKLVPEGILVAENGATKLVLWSAFSQSSTALSQLFRSRLTRPWTPTEAADISCLLSLPALCKGLDLAGEGLLTDSQLALAPSTVEAMQGSFDEVLKWIEESTEKSAAILEAAHPTAAASNPAEARQVGVLRERAALGLLIQILVAHQEHSLALCISMLETLLEDYGQTLLVHMLSSGRT